MILYSTLFGSHLYGTNIDTSDYDYKHIALPSLNDMLIGKPLQNVVKQTNTDGKNSNKDVDNEYIPIQIFAKHFLEGQIYALEIAFSNKDSHCGLFSQFNQELIKRFLTNNAKSIIGYSIAQSHLYSDKSKRYNELMQLKDIIQNNKQFVSVAELVTFPAIVELTQSTEFIKLTTYDIGNGVHAPCILVIDKIIPYNVSIEIAYKTLNTLFNRYDNRTKNSINHVDWKATAHAIRILNEGIELFETGEIKFPVSNASHLIDIRNGKVDISIIKQEFSEKLEKLKALEKSNNLISFSNELSLEFKEWLGSWMMKFYFKE